MKNMLQETYDRIFFKQMKCIPGTRYGPGKLLLLIFKIEAVVIDLQIIWQTNS